MSYAIEAKELTKKYKEKTAVNALNLGVKQGELFALLGVNGAGKTTTIKMLSGLSLPTAGDALLLGDSITRDPRRVKAHNGISPQETAVARKLTVRENLELMARIYGCNRSEAHSKAEAMIERLSLGEVAKDKARTLSGGMQRRLSIAMALISEPKILFLDERFC
jgi:ABC-2 type transport system ATP-binding protein